MPTRHDHLVDIKDRLKAGAIGCFVHVARVKTLDSEQLPAICLYAPEESSGHVLAQGTAPQFQPSFKLCIEVRVGYGDGFDVKAGQLVEKVKAILLTDPVWLARFKRYPTWHVQQYLDHRGEQSFCGEIMTIEAADRVPTVFSPNAGQLEVVTATAKLGDSSVTADLQQLNPQKQG